MSFLPVGVDPGLKGGCALVKQQYVLHYAHAPTAKSEQTKVESKILERRTKPDKVRKVNIYDVDEIVRILRRCDQEAAIRGAMGAAIFIEEPQPMQNRDSHASYLSTGRCLGAWEFAASRLEIPLYVVNPKHWKHSMGLSNDKSESLERARILFPTLPAEMREDIDLCEAALIAAWAQDHRQDLLGNL